MGTKTSVDTVEKRKVS